MKYDVREDPQHDTPTHLAEFFLRSKGGWNEADWSKPVLALGLPEDLAIPGAFTPSAMIQRDRELLGKGRVAMPDDSLGGAYLYLNGDLPHAYFRELLRDVQRAVAPGSPVNLVGVGLDGEMFYKNDKPDIGNSTLPETDQITPRLRNIISMVAIEALNRESLVDVYRIGDFQRLIHILQIVKTVAEDQG